MASSGLFVFLTFIVQTADKTAPATSSGLIVFLPLVGAILGAVVGAFGGAYANSRARDREAQKSDDRDRFSLLRVIDAEVYENMRLLDDMRIDPAVSDRYPSAAALSSDGWDQARPRLTRLLSEDEDHIFVLFRHYTSVRRIGALLGNPDAPISAKSKQERRVRTADIRKKRLRLLSRLAVLAYLDGEAIREKGKKHIGDLPDYYLMADRDEDADQMEDNGDGIDTEEASPT